MPSATESASKKRMPSETPQRTAPVTAYAGAALALLDNAPGLANLAIT